MVRPRGIARAALVALLLLVAPPARAAAVFTVTSSGEAWDMVPGDGVCDTGVGECTLRAALQESNATPGPDTIAFGLPGPGPHLIPVGAMLPAIDDPVTIDATTQPGYAGRPVVELDGSSAGPGAHGLTIRAGNTTVRGLVINSFDNHGIAIQGPAGNSTISGNYVGTDVSGSFARPNRIVGIGIGDSPGNMIGGSLPGQGNVISGNRDGVAIGGPGSTGNFVHGNYIGTDATGSYAVGNDPIGFGGLGVIVWAGATGNAIGGLTAGQRNVISGNGIMGVQFGVPGPGAPPATGNVVQGNYIGTDATGTYPVPNGSQGVIAFDSDNAIGGTDPGARNLISGNNHVGIGIFRTASGTVVQGNWVGLDATGTVALGNGGFLVGIEGPGNVIGGTAPGARNVITGNGSLAFSGPDAVGNVVQGNYLGTDATGSVGLGSGSAISMVNGPSGNLIGGGGEGEGNLISGTFSGVHLNGASGNEIRGNLIGVSAAGTPLGNGRGVHLGPGEDQQGGSSDNVIADNVIAHNEVGVEIAQGDGNLITGNTIERNGTGVAVGQGMRNRISQNWMEANEGLGIDLEWDGVTPNDPGDWDGGPNGLENYPVIRAAVWSPAAVVVVGRLDTGFPETHTIELYAHTDGHPSGHGEGTYLGSATPNRQGRFVAVLPAVAMGTLITAITIDPDGNTSEFARNRRALP